MFNSLEEVVDPKHTAVIVIDVQNDSASLKGLSAVKGVDISHTRSTIPPIKSVLSEARRLGIKIIFMKIYKDKDFEAGPRRKMRSQGRSAHKDGTAGYASGDTWGNAVLDELEPRPGERQLVKYVSSSFLGTPLDMLLRNHRIQSAVVMGLVTEGCVETTARDLEQYGYFPVVLSDCVSSKRRDLHDAALLIMSARYDVVESKQLLEIWGKTASRQKSSDTEPAHTVA